MAQVFGGSVWAAPTFAESAEYLASQDALSGSESASIALPLSDRGASTESAFLEALATEMDASGLAVEAQRLRALPRDSDIHSPLTAEDATTRVRVSGTERASAVEGPAALQVSVVATDSGTGADRDSLRALLADSDAGLDVVEGEQITVRAADAGSGDEAASLAAALRDGEALDVVQHGAPDATLADADAGQAVEGEAFEVFLTEAVPAVPSRLVLRAGEPWVLRVSVQEPSLRLSVTARQYVARVDDVPLGALVERWGLELAGV